MKMQFPFTVLKEEFQMIKARMVVTIRTLLDDCVRHVGVTLATDIKLAVQGSVIRQHPVKNKYIMGKLCTRRSGFGSGELHYIWDFTDCNEKR